MHATFPSDIPFFCIRRAALGGHESGYVSSQGCAYGGMGGVVPLPIFSNLQESWSKVSQAARGLATVFSVTFCFSNNLVTIVG